MRISINGSLADPKYCPKACQYLVVRSLPKYHVGVALGCDMREVAFTYNEYLTKWVLLTKWHMKGKIQNTNEIKKMKKECLTT